MSLTVSKKIQLKQRYYEVLSEIVEKNQLGQVLARQKLGSIPKYLVIQELQDINKIGRTGLLLLKIQFNSESGSFNGELALKEFSSYPEAERMIQLNNWLMQRVANNPRVKIPKIFSSGERYIIYEGIEGETFEDSTFDMKMKLLQAGEALATYHSAHTIPANVERYRGLLSKMIEAIPINQDRKDHLYNLGSSLLEYYPKNLSGVYCYGDFHPGNLMLSKDGKYVYIIDPEFIESTISADRFEDITNFFIFEASTEFLTQSMVTRVVGHVQVFLDAYNNYLKRNGSSLETIYGEYYWLAFYFHLGLTSLIKGAIATRTASRYLDEPVERSMDEIIQAYRMTKDLWIMGLQFMPIKAFPPSVRPKELHLDGWVITWQIVFVMMQNILKNHSTFQLLFTFSQQNELSINEALEFWKISKKQILEERIINLNKWTNQKVITISKNSVILDKHWQANLKLPQDLSSNPELSAKLLFNLLLKDPLYSMLQYLSKHPVTTIKDIEAEEVINKKDIKDLLKEMKEQKIIIEEKQEIRLLETWQTKLNLPIYFDFAYFE